MPFQIYEFLLKEKNKKKIKENKGFSVQIVIDCLLSHLTTFSAFSFFMQIYDTYIRTKALSIVYSCTSMLGAISGVYKVFPCD